MRHRAGTDGEDRRDGSVDASFDSSVVIAGGAQNAGSLSGVRSARVRIGVGAGVVILIAALLGAVLVSAIAQRGSAGEVAAGSANGSDSSASSDTRSSGLGAQAASGDSESATAPVLVHVLGAVKKPGLVSLTTGARVVDAVAAAGGLTDDAEVAGVNLARVLADGEQLVVPHVGEVLAPAAGAGAGAGAGGGASGAGASEAMVNLNTAGQAELETLPRIGPALAQRILDYRKANGRFKAVADLMKVTGIGQKLFEGLKDRLAV